MKAKTLFFALAAATLAACGNGNTPNQQTQEPDSVTIATTPDAKEVRMTHDDLSAEYIITNEGIGDFKIGTTIPDSHPDYVIKEVLTVDEEEFEELSYEVSKDGEMQFVIFPAYIDETDAQSDEIGTIMVVSDKYIYNGNHVGDNINDILKAQPKLQVTFYDDKVFRINDGNITYFVNSDAYDGPLPEVPFDIPAPVENPTFKPDAKVSAIWITQ